MRALKDLFLQKKQQHYDDNVNFFIKFFIKLQLIFAAVGEVVG